MPDWFATFVKSKFDPFMEMINTRSDELSARLTDLEKSHAAVKEELSETRTKVDQMESANSTTAATTAAICTNSQLDSREICISGIPKSFTNDHAAAVMQVFEATNNSQNLNFVSAIRVFHPLIHDHKVPVSNDDSRYFSLAIKTVSLGVRDDIVANLRLLRGKTAREVFGGGGERQVYMTAIWPRLVYDLLRATAGKSKALNYLRPSNLVVYARPDNAAPMIPVHSITDLDKLQPLRTTVHDVIQSKSP